jgi:hypothetical protein
MNVNFTRNCCDTQANILFNETDKNTELERVPTDELNICIIHDIILLILPLKFAF